MNRKIVSVHRSRLVEFVAGTKIPFSIRNLLFSVQDVAARRSSAGVSNVGQLAEFFIGTHRANLVTLVCGKRSPPRLRPPLSRAATAL